MFVHPIFTYAVVIATAVVTWMGFYRRGIEARYLFDSQRIKDHGEHYRMITSGFLHGDWFHFGLNMMMLVIWGPMLEREIGPMRFLILYFGCIYGGSLLAYYMHKNHHYLALGASGGTCGILLASIFLLPAGTYLQGLIIPIPVPAWAYAVGFILYTVFGMRSRDSKIGHDAHMGGAVTGMAIITLFKPSVITEHPLLWGFFAVFTGALLWYLWKNPLMLSMKNFGVKNPFSKHDKRQKMESYDAFELDAKEAESDADKLDRLLAKVSDVGFDKLSPIEKMQLKQLSARMSDRDDRRRDRRNKRERGE